MALRVLTHTSDHLGVVAVAVVVVVLVAVMVVVVMALMVVSCARPRGGCARL